MASGTINLSTNNSKLAGKIQWWSSSNGSVSNSSNIDATLYVRRTDGYTTTGTFAGKINIAGQEQTANVHTSVGSDWVGIVSIFGKKIQHNNDGTGSCNISGSCNGPSGTSLAGAVVSGSGTAVLDTIPRNSAVSLSKTNFNIGETITINTNRQSSSFTHTLRLVIGSLNKTLATNVGTSYNWATNANQDLYGQVYNTASKSGTIYCDCYSGSSLIGTSSVTFTANAVKSSISSNANWTAGNTLTVNISRPSSKYTHTVEVLVNGTTVASANNVSTSTSFNTTTFHTNVFRALAQTASKSTSIKLTTHNGSANLGSTTINGTVTAPAASTANVPTWTAGNTYSCSITRANSSFTHTVQLLVANTSIFTATGVGTSVTKSDTTFHTNVFKALAQAASKNTTVRVTTYYNGIQVRTQTSKTGTVTAPAASTSSIGNFNIGDTKTITITRANSSFTHKIDVNFGNWAKTLSNNATTSVTWNTSTDASTMYSKIPNSTRGIGQIVTTTYYNGVQVRGSTTRQFTAYVTNSNPTFTAFEYNDNNSTTVGITSNSKLQIQNESNLVISATPAIAKNSATISKYIATINGKNYESKNTSIVIGPISKSGTLSLEVKAVDSRGLTASVTKNITVISYSKPAYNVNVTRENNYEEETNIAISNGKYTSLQLSWNDGGLIVTNPNPNEIVTSRYRYKASDGNYGSWKSITLNENKPADKDETNFNFSELVGNLDNSKNFIFEVEIADKLNSVVQTFTLKNGIPIMAMRKTAIGINKIPTISKGLDIDGDIKNSGHLYLDGMTDTTTGSKSKLVFGNNNNAYAVLRASTNKTLVIADSLNDNTNGIEYNPSALKFAPLTNQHLNLGSEDKGWKNIYGTNLNIVNEGKIIFTANNASKEIINARCAITLGQDQASSSDANLRFHSWYGIGFAPSISGQTIPQGENAVYINVRTGSLTARGNITAKAFNGNATTATSLENPNSYVHSGVRVESFDSSYLEERSFIGSIQTNNVWYNLINVRHRGGLGDGYNFGMQIRSQMTTGFPKLAVRQQNNGSWGDWESIQSGYNLYNNTSGTTGTVTLNRTVENYTYIDIFYGKGTGSLQSVRVYNPNGKSASLVTGYFSYTGQSSATFQQILTKIVKISGTSITTTSNSTGLSNLKAGNQIELKNDNSILIYRVDGFRV